MYPQLQVKRQGYSSTYKQIIQYKQFLLDKEKIGCNVG